MLSRIQLPKYQDLATHTTTHFTSYQLD
uniref:Uncharacterized protein n=1 Tax=Arundo donax TaxID=35708 RepID=A0A0A8Z235_ARUDO